MTRARATDTSDTLREQFRVILTLLKLVTGLNNDGHPTLRNPTLGCAKEPKAHLSTGETSFGCLDLMQTKPSLVMNAFAAILVRNHEIVVAAARDPGPKARYSSNSLTVVANGLDNPQEEFFCQYNSSWRQYERIVE